MQARIGDKGDPFETPEEHKRIEETETSRRSKDRVKEEYLWGMCVVCLTVFKRNCCQMDVEIKALHNHRGVHVRGALKMGGVGGLRGLSLGSKGWSKPGDATREEAFDRLSWDSRVNPQRRSCGGRAKSSRQGGVENRRYVEREVEKRVQELLNMKMHVRSGKRTKRRWKIAEGGKR